MFPGEQYSMSLDFNTILYSALCVCFGLDLSSPEASVLDPRSVPGAGERAPDAPESGPDPGGSDAGGKSGVCRDHGECEDIKKVRRDDLP